jgi:hypothetical protein
MTDPLIMIREQSASQFADLVRDFHNLNRAPRSAQQWFDDFLRWIPCQRRQFIDDHTKIVARSEP